MVGAAGTLALSAGLLSIIPTARYGDQRRRDRQRLVYELDFPRDLTAGQVTCFVRLLTRLRPPRGWLLGRDSVVFELVGQPDRLIYRLRLPERQAGEILAQMRSVAPGIRATALEADNPATRLWARELRQLDLGAVLRTDAPEVFAASLLTALQPLEPGEQLVWQWVIWPLALPLLIPVQLSTAKLREPVFVAAGRIGAVAASPLRQRELVERVLRTTHSLEQPAAILRRQRSGGWAAGRRLANGATALFRSRLLANSTEVGTLVGWPLGAPVVPGLRLLGGRDLPPSLELDRGGRVLGQSTYSGLVRPIGLAVRDSLMHTLVCGPTGTGKSTLLLNLITQDLQAGRGCVVLDPSGDLIADVLERVPGRRQDDVILLDPSDLDRPVPLNPLVMADDPELAADQLLGLLRQRHPASWGPRLEEILRSALLALATAPEATLAELPLLLTNASYRRRLLLQLDQTVAASVGSFFSRFEDWTDGERSQAVAAVLNKITPLIGRRALRAMVGQARPTWTMNYVLTHNQILLVSLPAGRIGSTATDLVGGLVLTMLWNAVQGRSTLARHLRPPTFVYIDETPRFLPALPELADFLARARGFGVGLVFALQHLSQLPRPLQDGVLSEARSKVVFQAGPVDAVRLARALGPSVDADLLQHLAVYTAVAGLVANGRVMPPVTIATPPPPSTTGSAAELRARSREGYGRPLVEVETAIAERSQVEPGPRGSRRRTS